MQWIVVDKTQGEDGKDQDRKGHRHPGHCPSRFFGLWVATGIVAAGAAIWMLVSWGLG